MMILFTGVLWLFIAGLLAVSISGNNTIKLTPRKGFILIGISFLCGMFILGVALALG